MTDGLTDKSLALVVDFNRYVEEYQRLLGKRYRFKLFDGVRTIYYEGEILAANPTSVKIREKIEGELDVEYLRIIEKRLVEEVRT